MTWDEWQKSRDAKRAALRKRGLDAPSRRIVSYNASERFMRAAFGGDRIPAWAKGNAASSIVRVAPDGGGTLVGGVVP